MRHYRSSPRSLGDALTALSDELAPATVLADVQRAWGASVGASIAEQAQPTSERGGVLTVSCASSVWAQELDLMAPQIIARLNAALGRPSLTRLRCTAVGHGR